MRRLLAGLLAGGAVCAALASSAAAATATQLVLPQGTAFAILGHSCGGIQEQAYATGFDPTSGYPTGDVHLQTRCGGSGRGGGYHTTTYTAWVGVVMLAIALVFVWRSFYAMRIPKEESAAAKVPVTTHLPAGQFRAR